MAIHVSKGDRFENRTIRSQSIENPVAMGNTDRGLSPDLWATCPVELLKKNPQRGTYMFDDFVNGGIVVAANTSTANAAVLGTTGKWAAFTDATAGTVITTETTNYQGVVKLETDTIDEDCTIAYPSTAETAGVYQFSDTTRLWMEARVSILNITTNKFNGFFGFAEKGLLATNEVITDSDVMADVDYVGFQKTFAGTTLIASVFNTNGQTAHTPVDTDAVTVEANTFTKIGLYCDGTTVFFYQNGVRGTGVTIVTADFPDDKLLAFYVSLMAGHGDKCSVSVDWVAIAQAYTLVDKP